jgi:hypothetical protein
VVPLPGAAEVLRPAVLAEGLQDGGDGGGALRRQVPADPPGLVQGDVQVEVPVGEPAAAGVVVGVGLEFPPGLVGGLGEELQVVEVRAGGGGLYQDLVGFLLEFLVVDAAGPAGDLLRPGDGERPGGGRGGGGVPGGASGGRRPWRPCGRGGFWRRARRRRWRSRWGRGRRRRRTAAGWSWSRRRAGSRSRRVAQGPRRGRGRRGRRRPGSSGRRRPPGWPAGRPRRCGSQCGSQRSTPHRGPRQGLRGGLARQSVGPHRHRSRRGWCRAGAVPREVDRRVRGWTDRRDT